MAEFRLSNFTSGAVLTAAELNTGLTYTDYTPDWTQSTAITKTVDWARYTKFGKMVMGSIKMTSTGAGTANNKMTISLPVSASSNNFIIGTMNYVDNEVTDVFGNTFTVYFESSTTMSFQAGTITTGSLSQSVVAPATGTGTPTSSSIRFGQDYTNLNNASVTGVTVASGDVIYIKFQYEAA